MNSAVQKKPLEVVVFDNPEKRRLSEGNKQSEKKQHLQSKEKEHFSKQRVYDQKKAQYDIRKLGIYGMDKTNKETAMTEFLLELGAKPPKNRCYHIKEHQERMKQKKQEQETLEEIERKAGLKTKKPRTKRKNNKDDLLHYVDGQIGFYKNGVQFVKRHKS